MMHISARAGAIFLIALFAAMCVISFLFGVHKDAFVSPNADRVYYEEFYTRLWHPALPQSFSNPPPGTNVIFGGPDGADGLNLGIHFEPLKYLAAAVFNIFGSMRAVELLYILLCFSPLLYGAWLLRKGAGGMLLLVCLAAYALSPAAVPTATDDLRPYIVLLPALLMFFLAVLYRRPAWEKFLFLNVLLLAREEALVLALPVLAYMTVREYNKDGISRASAGLWLNWLNWLNWLLWLLVNVAYFLWIAPHYAVRGGWFALLHIATGHPALAIAMGIVGVGALLCALYYRRYILAIPHLPDFLLLAPFFLLLIASPFLTLSQPFSSAYSIYLNLTGRFGMILTVSLLMLVLAQLVDKHVRAEVLARE